MKKRLNKKLSAFITMIIFAVFLFNGSCSKDTKSPDPDQTTTGSPKIIYTDVNPDSVILKRIDTDSFKLDLNNDGITDFEFDRSYREDRCSDDLLGSFAWDNDLSLRPTNGSNAIMTSGSNLPLALDSASAIAPDSLWANASQVLLYGAINASGHCVTSLPPIRGYWLNVLDKYLGLKFIKGNNTYYGWARLSSSYSLAAAPHHNLIIGGRLIIKDYAYNSVPNQPILAGQTK